MNLMIIIKANVTFDFLATAFVIVCGVTFDGR